MDETTVQNLASVSDLLEQAIETICRGEDFSLDFADDWLHSFFGAVVELARLSGSGSRENLSRAEALLAGVSQRVDDGDEVVLTAEQMEALQSLQCLARAARPMAEVLDREDGLLYALINPANSLGNTVLGENDRGVYENPWAALADLGVVKRESQNPHIYLARLTPAEAVIDPAEVVVLYAPDQGEVLIVDGEIIDTSDGTDPGDYLDIPRVFFDDLGRALGIHFTVRSIEVVPWALDGEYWSWVGVAEAWLSAWGAGRGGEHTGDSSEESKSD